MRLERALVLVALLAACGSDVIVGLETSSVSSPGDGGGADGDVSAEGGTSLDGGASGLTGVARTGADLVVSGWTGANAPTDSTSDFWLGRMTTAGAETWGARGDDSAAADVASGVVALGDGTWLAAGTVTTTAGRRGFVRKLDAANAALWTQTYGSAGAPTDVDITAIATGGAGSLVLGGNEEGGGQPKDGWAARLDAAGSPIWRIAFHGGQANATKIYAVTATVVDQVLAGGTREMVVDGGLVEVPCILQLNTDGAIWNSSEAFGVPLGKGTVRGIVPEANRDSTVCLDSDGTIVVARLDSGIGLVSSFTYSDPRGPLVLGGCAPTSDGALLVVGSVTLPTGPEPWSAKHARAPFGTIWQRAIPNTLGPAHAAAVTGDDNGGGYAVGSTSSSPPRRWFASIPGQ